MDETQRQDDATHGFWQWIQQIDRRAIYVVLFIILTVAVVTKSQIRITPTSNAYRLYTAVEACPDDGVILIMCTWDYGTQGESWPQYEALVHHCLTGGKRFAIISGNAVAAAMHNQIVENRVAAVERTTGRKIVYGRDWINLGFKAGGFGGGSWGAFYAALADDIRGFFGNRDFKNNELSKLPIMERIRNAGDFYMIFEISFATEGIYSWIGIVRPKYPKPLYGGGVTAIVAPDVYPYVDSGQLVAMLDGYRGAAEYEKLLGFDKQGRGHRQANAQSWAHILILALLILGNVGYFMARRK